jgi:hypothetical protein
MDVFDFASRWHERARRAYGPMEQAVNCLSVATLCEPGRGAPPSLPSLLPEELAPTVLTRASAARIRDRLHWKAAGHVADVDACLGELRAAVVHTRSSAAALEHAVDSFLELPEPEAASDSYQPASTRLLGKRWAKKGLASTPPLLEAAGVMLVSVGVIEACLNLSIETLQGVRDTIVRNLLPAQRLVLPSCDGCDDAEPGAQTMSADALARRLPGDHGLLCLLDEVQLQPMFWKAASASGHFDAGPDAGCLGGGGGYLNQACTAVLIVKAMVRSAEVSDLPVLHGVFSLHPSESRGRFAHDVVE